MGDGADSVKFGAPNVSFGMFVAPVWHLGGHRAMQGDLGAHGRRPWGSRLGFSSICGAAICMFLVNLGTTIVFLACVFAGYVF